MRIFHIARLAALVLAGFVPAAGAHHGHTVRGPLDGNSFVVRNVRVFDGERVVEGADVVVRDGRIAAVGHDGAPSDLLVIDGTGRSSHPPS